MDAPAQCLGRRRCGLAGAGRGGRVRSCRRGPRTKARSGRTCSVQASTWRSSRRRGGASGCCWPTWTSTMIRQECIDELAAEAGVGPRVAAITARAMNGELDFEAALRERVALLKGLDAAVIDRVLETRITMTPGGRDAGGDDEGERRADGAGLGRVHRLHDGGGGAARLRRAPGELLLTEAGGWPAGRRADPGARRQGGGAARGLRQHWARRRPMPSRWATGPTTWGCWSWRASGWRCTPSPRCSGAVRVRVNHGDLTALLYLQGYARAEFASDG